MAEEEKSLQYAEHPLVWDRTVEHRLYQKNIADSARSKNTLVILPTALGKTVIAALTCAETLYNYRDRRVLVMAPTRPLVSQHLKSFSSILKLPEEQMAMVTGKTTPEARRAVWDKKDVRLVFATPEVVRNDLEEKRLQMEDFILLVFDEAHRAVKDYAYTAIAHEYVGQSIYPLILAMTASPGADRKRMQEVCDNLSIENVEYRSEEDSDVKPYVNPIDVKWEWFDLPEEFRYISSSLRSMLEERLQWLIQRGILGNKKNVNWVFKRDLIEAGEALRYRLELTMEEQRGPIYMAIMKQSSALTLMYCAELIESQGSYSLKAFFDRIEEDGGKAHASLLKDPRIIEIRTLLENMKNEHPKNGRILELVKESVCSNNTNSVLNDRNYSDASVADVRNGSKNRRVLVFTQYRDTARHIVDVLVGNGIKSSRFVGQAKRQGDVGMTQDEQSAVLESFRNGEFNVLVATSIAEEGLDIPEVDLVIFYEPIPSEIRYIQRRGRTGRKAAGSVVILAATDTIDTRHLYASKRRVEKMKESLLTINAILRPIERTALEPHPITPEELSSLEEARERQVQRLRRVVEAELQGKKDQLIEYEIQSEIENRVKQLREKSRHAIVALEGHGLTSDYRKEVARVARHIHSELAKAGRKGVDVDLLGDTLSIDERVLNEAMKKLEKLRRIIWLDEGTVAIVESVQQISGKTYSIYVKKVVQGKAFVLVDDKWQASLNHFDYEGPRELLKVGSKFNVVGELYEKDGSLNVKVKQIV